MNTGKLTLLMALSLVAISLFASRSISAEMDPSANFQGQLWQDIAKPTATVNRLEQQVLPSAYRLVQTNVDLLRAQLNSAPLEGSSGTAVVLTLPLPDGEFGRYTVTNAPIMESELAAKYPEIQTYKVQGIDDPTASGRLDMTPRGFHAYLQSSSGEVYIDPYQNDDSARYISYHKSASQSAQARTVEKILQQEFRHARIQTVSNSVPVGNIKRTYQMVMSSSGEFADFTCNQGGDCSTTAAKRANAMAAITTGMNRINQIYERDLAISFILVNGNDALVFTDKDTDDYTDGTDAETMIDELPDAIDGVIPLNNYDIGHVIGAGGGGGLASPFDCNATDHYDKASGATALFSPIGDPFWVDYTAHEIGHQFNADHSYNAKAGGACTTGVNSSAFEPGSGTTIMSYVGICGGQNLQSNADAMFNAGSYNEIIAHVTTGRGATCDTETNTGNTAPTVSAGNDYTIPSETPFRLTAVATDAEQATSALTTSWEQFSLGAGWNLGSVLPNTDEQDNMARPILRVFLPTSSPVRIIPSLANILDGTYKNSGEDLPSIDQTITFKATVRDNAMGVASDDMLVTVEDSAGPFRVTSHATNQSINTSTSTMVMWDVANTNQAPVNCANVDIGFSADNGATFTTNLATNTPNDGSEQVTIPATLPATTQGRIQVKCSNNIFFDIGKGQITIVAGPAIPNISLGAASYAVDEDAGTVAVEIKLSAATTVDVDVDYTTVDGSATAGGDYISATSTATFLPGEVSKIIPISIVDNTVIESDEAFGFQISNPVGGVLTSPVTATIAIADDEAANPAVPKISLSAATYTVTEGAGTVDVEILLSVATTATISVDYDTYDDSATDTTDYDATFGTATFAPNETSKIISIPITDDSDMEGSETFEFELSNETGGPLVDPSVAVITIADDDVPIVYKVYLPILMR